MPLILIGWPFARGYDQLLGKKGITPNVEFSLVSFLEPRYVKLGYLLAPPRPLIVLSVGFRLARPRLWRQAWRQLCGLYKSSWRKPRKASSTSMRISANSRGGTPTMCGKPIAGEEGSWGSEEACLLKGCFAVDFWPRGLVCAFPSKKQPGVKVACSCLPVIKSKQIGRLLPQKEARCERPRRFFFSRARMEMTRGPKRRGGTRKAGGILLRGQLGGASVNGAGVSWETLQRSASTRPLALLLRGGGSLAVLPSSSWRLRFHCVSPPFQARSRQTVGRHRPWWRQGARKPIAEVSVKRTCERTISYCPQI